MAKTSARKQSSGTKQFDQRIAALRGRVRKWGCAALLVSNPRDIRYLTGFVGDDSWALVTAKAGKVFVLSDFRFEEQITREAPQVQQVMRKAALSDELGLLVRRLKLRHIGVQASYMTLLQRDAIVKVVGKVRVSQVNDGLIVQRAVKSDAEVKLIEKSLAIQQEAFRRTLKFIKPGQTEFEVAAYLEYQMRSLGADGTSFPSIIAAGANASLPHAIPGRAKIRKGRIVLIDWGSKLGGYCSDLTRVVALGSMPAKIREIYKVVLDAQLAAIDAIKPGRSMKEIDAIARGMIDKAGYGDRFGHGLGHGIGLDIHEQPVLSFRGEGVLEPGHVVTVEPGIYLPGVGGVRIEDDVLVTARGHRVLSDLPKDLSSAII